MFESDLHIFAFVRVKRHVPCSSPMGECIQIFLIQSVNVCMVEYSMASSAYNLTLILHLIHVGRSLCKLGITKELG